MAYKGKARDRVAKAKQEGFEGILYVRSAVEPRDRLNLTHVSGSNEEATLLLSKVLRYLPEPYKELSGDGPFA